MRQLTPDISISTSQLWETNTGIIRGPEGAILVDPGVFETEFEAIAREAGLVAAGFCTHAHWDHVLWHRSFGDAPRFATSETIALIRKDQNRILDNLTNTEAHIHHQGFSDGSELWDRTQLFREQPIGWGSGSIAGVAIELIHIPGHEDGQAALLLPEHRVCFVADTLSDIETPSVHGGSGAVALYLQTLDRLQSLINQVDWIVPGHGNPADRAEAQARLDADRRYLTALVPMVNSAPKGEEVEDLARRFLVELGEQRAQSELSWSMHLDNIQQLMSEREQLEADLPERRSSRLILLDEHHRVWMLRIDDPVRPRWVLPGGGVEEGESWEDAARRELWEECAINDAEIGPMVATRERLARIDMVPTPDGMVEIEPRWIISRERNFLVRVNGQQPGIGNMFGYETADYTRQAWLSAEDIRASHEIVYPLGLADLIDALAIGDLPKKPWVWEDQGKLGGPEIELENAPNSFHQYWN